MHQNTQDESISFLSLYNQEPTHKIQAVIEQSWGGLHISPVSSVLFIFQLVSPLTNPFLPSTGQLQRPPLSQPPCMTTRFLQFFPFSHCTSNILHLKTFSCFVPILTFPAFLSNFTTYTRLKNTSL